MRRARMTTCVLRCRHISVLQCEIFCDARKTFSGKARCRRAHHFNLTTPKPCARVPSMRHAFLMRSRRSFSERWVSPVKCSPPSSSRKAWVMGFEFEIAMVECIRKKRRAIRVPDARPADAASTCCLSPRPPSCSVLDRRRMRRPFRGSTENSLRHGTHRRSLSRHRCRIGPTRRPAKRSRPRTCR